MSRLQEYVRPGSMEEAVERKKDSGGTAFYLAGGTDALVLIPEHARTAIDIMAIDMGGVRSENGAITIGANTILRDIERHPAIQQVADGALVEAIRETGPWLIRNAATLTGNLCNASPSADSAPILLALDAELSLSDGRVIKLDDFFVGPHRTVLEDEMVTDIRIHPRGRRGLFHKHSRSKSDIAQVNLAITARVEEQTLSDVRIAFGSVGPRPMRAKQSEALLEGTTMNSDLLELVVASARSEISPIDDWRATAQYRRHAAGVMLQRAVRGMVAGT